MANLSLANFTKTLITTSNNKCLGLTGSKAKFSVLLPRHKLSFTTRLEETLERETNLPSEASIDLPKVIIFAKLNNLNKRLSYYLSGP